MIKVTLNNGIEMPQIGLGTFQTTNPKECRRSVLDALEIGYRLIDTAQGYGNEQFIGEALAESSVPRKDIFLVTKVWMGNYENAYESVLQSMERLHTDYLDLVLLHWPFGDVYKAWRDLEGLYHEGKARAIGVSNFNAGRLIDLINYNEVVPSVNQIETNIYSQQEKNREWMDKYGVQHMGYAPFGQGHINEVYDNPQLKAIAEAHHKTTRQVVLRFQLQIGCVVIPKSVHKQRLEENFNIFDFELSPQEMQTIASMNREQPLIGNPENPALVESSRKW
ncbi:MAG: aldo/keto reductase [Bacteroidota bacterium]|nr:aldo/keto reductase [Bacteroidota bacterium]